MSGIADHRVSPVRLHVPAPSPEDYPAAAGAIEPRSRALLARQAEIESSARSYPRRLPIAIARAMGPYVQDVDGVQYIDCLAGAGALALGHNHPVVTEAIRAALDAGVAFQTLDLQTPAKHDFADLLLSILPSEFSANARIQFCGPTGADAVEAAVKLVRMATGRQTIMAFTGAYHGMSAMTLALTGNRSHKAASFGCMSGVHFMPFPNEGRSVWRGDVAARAAANLDHIDEIIADDYSGVERPAGVILEPIQGEGGVNSPPAGWLRRLAEITNRQSVPLILDEVQTGLGRTGDLFAFDHEYVIPDVLVLSKAIGGGLPLSVVVYRGELDTWAPGSHAGTFRGNQLAFAAGAATIREVIRSDLPRNARIRGMELRSRLEEIVQPVPHSVVRGRGLMIGIEFILERRDGALERNTALAARVQSRCLANGLIVEIGGRAGATVRFLPPLNIEAKHVDEIASRFQRGLGEALVEA
jgi:diaminobutyrate-2-oxoglutarate transaminase